MKAISFWFIFCESSLYFSWISFICGCSLLMRFIERVLAAVRGQKMALMTMVMTMIASAYGSPQPCRPFMESRSTFEKNPKKPPRSMTASIWLPCCVASFSNVRYLRGPA